MAIGVVGCFYFVSYLRFVLLTCMSHSLNKINKLPCGSRQSHSSTFIYIYIYTEENRKTAKVVRKNEIEHGFKSLHTPPLISK